MPPSRRRPRPRKQKPPPLPPAARRGHALTRRSLRPGLEKTIGIPPDDEAARWLAEHDPELQRPKRKPNP